MGNLFSTGIRPAIDEYLKEESLKVRDYKEYWSASSAGYCMRKVIFERLRVPHIEKESDDRKTRIFESGKIFHEWIQAITKEAGLSIAQELELQDEELMIRGHIDDLVLVGEETVGDKLYAKGVKDSGHPLGHKKLILYDYKTAHSKWFEYVKGRPMSHYNKMQLGTYMYMLRKYEKQPVKDVSDVSTGFPFDNLLKDLTEARILKISKDDLRLHEQQLLWTPALEKEVVGYWATLNGHWKKQVIPACTCGKYENGFMALEKWNPYYYKGAPCSIDWYNEWKANNAEITPVVEKAAEEAFGVKKK